MDLSSVIAKNELLRYGLRYQIVFQSSIRKILSVHISLYPFLCLVTYILI